MPLVAGIVVARATQRPQLMSLGLLCALACPVAMAVLLLAGESLIDGAESLPGLIAWLLNPVALVPGVFALVIVLRGCRWATPRS